MLSHLLSAVAASPADPVLRAIAADAMEEQHGHRTLEPFLPAPLMLTWRRGFTRLISQQELNWLFNDGRGLSFPFDE